MTRELEHDALHCHICSANEKLLQALSIIAGLNQRILSKFEEANGTPKGQPYVFSQASPAWQTNYAGPQLAYDGVIRGLVVSGPGNVTVSLKDNLEIGGAVTLAVIGSAGAAVSIPIHQKMPLGAYLQIQTDSTAGTGLISLTAWIEPIVESDTEYFRMRR